MAAGVKRQMTNVANTVAKAVNICIRYFEKDLDMTISSAKSGIVSSLPVLSAMAARRVEGRKVKAADEGKLLGAGTVAGRRRTTRNTGARVQKFSLKKKRIKALGDHGLSRVDAARATGMPAMGYSGDIG